MNKKAMLSVIALSSLVVSGSWTRDDIAMIGWWRSSNGAMLHIKEINQQTGQIKVSFKSPDDLYRDGPHEGIGYIGGDLKASSDKNLSLVKTISFAIRWPDQSIMSWTGTCRVVNGSLMISAVWNWAEPAAKNFISHIRSGYSEFTPYTQKK